MSVEIVYYFTECVMIRLADFVIIGAESFLSGLRCCGNFDD